jgi:hypothetical protein
MRLYPWGYRCFLPVHRERYVNGILPEVAG